MTLFLVARWPEHESHVTLHEGVTVTIGYSRTNDLPIRAPGVSRQHATAELTAEDHVRIVDLGSKNGISADGGRVPSIELARGMTARIGIATVSLTEDEIAIAISERHISQGVSPTTISLDFGGPTVDALNWAAAAEAAGDGVTAIDRHALLGRALAALKADGLALCLAEASGVAIVDLAGTLPDAPTLSEAIRSEVVPAGWTVIRIAESQYVVSWTAEARIDPAFARDFLRYAGRVLFGAIPATTPPGRASGIDLPPGVIAAGSAPMRQLYEQIGRLTYADTILIYGEHGSGKESIARTIHLNGWSARGPFRAQNCAAISPELFEAELFGIERGAATNVAARPGLFRDADKGTLLLDEISELPLDKQAKLLRVLQNREVQPVGTSKTIPVRLRVIAATNRDLPSLIEAGGFRADLYYRLQQVAIRVPPLRERREDIYDLTKFFLERESEIHHRHVTRVSEEAFRLLLGHDWPGNVRELEGEITRAVLACPIGGTIRPEHLSITAPTRPERGSLADMRASADRESVLRAITEAQGNRSLAARILRVSRKTLYALMKRHGIPL